MGIYSPSQLYTPGNCILRSTSIDVRSWDLQGNPLDCTMTYLPDIHPSIPIGGGWKWQKCSQLHSTTSGKLFNKSKESCNQKTHNTHLYTIHLVSCSYTPCFTLTDFGLFTTVILCLDFALQNPPRVFFYLLDVCKNLTCKASKHYPTIPNISMGLNYVYINIHIYIWYHIYIYICKNHVLSHLRQTFFMSANHVFACIPAGILVDLVEVMPLHPCSKGWPEKIRYQIM